MSYITLIDLILLKCPIRLFKSIGGYMFKLDRDYKIIKKLIIVFILIGIPWMLYIAVDAKCSYVFCVEKEKYQDNEESYMPNYIDTSGIKQFYSPITQIIVNDKVDIKPFAESGYLPEDNLMPVIIIEHAETLIQGDIDLNPKLSSKNPKDCLFTSVITNITNIKSIDIKEYYNGKELSVAGTYLYQSNVSYLDISYDKPIVDISNEDSLKNRQSSQAYIKIFKMPLQEKKLNNVFLPKSILFKNPIHQIITIQYYDDDSNLNTIKREYDLYWIKYLNFNDYLISSMPT